MSLPTSLFKSLTIGTTAIILLSAPVYLNAAQGPDGRSCNLQGREIALRISEEVSNDLSADDRAQVAAIAEAVCLDFAASASTARPLPNQANTPVISRPSAQQQAATEVAAPDTTAGELEEEDEEGSGLLGNLRIIPPEERVQRPGLKRP